jgi:hypothetical protein
VTSLCDALERFNRKERNLLVRDALGHTDQRLKLSESFRNRIRDALRIKNEIGADAWWATDYHFDWLAGALTVYVDGGVNEDARKNAVLIEGTQEDVDMIIATGSDLILIEAKAYGAWENGQFKSKLDRIERLQEYLGNIEQNSHPERRIRLHLLLMSITTPQKLNVDKCPESLKREGQIPWIKLDVLSEPDLLVSRCDKLGNEKVSTEYWRLVKLKRPIQSPAQIDTKP